nr:uncharacterized mitochondrial protein AtMg00810-like [Tanacetum cinerariifolium]GEY79843.1 uncharacterized mitochondrial protein AtMg00810-like [Tanacetum cinerariifolium]
MPNPEDITDPTTAMNMALALMAKAFKLNYSTLTNNNQRISSNPCNRQIAQPGMNMGQDRQMEMVGGNGENQFREYAGQNIPRVQNFGNQNGLIGVSGNANQNLNGNAADLDEIEEVNANCISMANLQQASTSGTQTDRAPVYDSDGSAEINDLHLSSSKQIMTLNEEILDLNKQLSKEKSTVSFLLEEKKKLKSDFKIREDEFLDKQIQLEKRIKKLDNIVVKIGQSIQMIHMLSPKPDSFYHTEQKMALGYRNPFYLKQAQKKQQSLYDRKVLLKKHDPPVVHDLEKTLQLAQEIVSQDIMSVVQNNSVGETSNLQTELEHTKERFENGIIKKKNEYAKIWNDWYKKCEECKLNKISYDKAYKDMQQKIKWLQAQLGDLKGKSKDTSCVSDTRNPLSQKLENENMGLEFQDKKRGTSANTKFAKQSIVGNLPKVGETHALSNPVTSNSVPTPQESKVVKNDKVITPRMFKINPFKTSREEKHVPNTVRASARTKPITVSQPFVFTKKDVNFDSNGLSSIGIDNTKTIRPQPRSNTKNNRVPFAFTSSGNKNKRVELEEQHRNLLLSNNKKHMSSACNNIKLDSQNVKSKKQKANVSIKENQKKQQPKFKKTKKVGFIERLATHKPSKPRFFIRWSPTGRLLDLKGKIIASSESESQSNCSNGDNACTSNTLEPKIKRFPNSTSLLGRNLKLLINFVWKFMGTVRFKNDHVAVIMGFGDLQWGNILITRVYFVEGLGHNLFSVRQFCDSDLEVAFRRNACFIRNLEGVDLLLRNRTTNLYTINLYDMATASPICLMARAFSTKSWLWHQRLSHLNFDTINDLAKNDLVSGLLKFKYHKEHLCPSCKQGKRERASHPPKPVPNSRQMLHLLHMNFCGPMRIASINEKRKKPDILFLHVFEALCYPKHDREDIGKLGAKAMAFEQRNSKPRLQSMTSGLISSGLDLTYAPSTITTQQPTEGELDLLFKAMYDDYIGGQLSAALRTVPATQAHQALYGLKQAPRAWNDKLSTFLLQNHFFKGTIDPTLFIRRLDNDILVVKVYADDIIFGSTHPMYIQLFSDLIKSRFKMSMMGEMTFFLGLQVNQSLCGIFINQSNYVLEILKKYGMESCDLVDADYAGCKDPSRVLPVERNS